MSRNLKQYIPASSRSFHQKTDAIIKDLQLLVSIQDKQLELTRRIINRQSNGKAIYLIGEPGHPNYGDELIAHEWLTYLASVCPEVPVYLDCTRPGPAAAILRNAHPNFHTVDTISRLTFEVPENWESETKFACEAERIGSFVRYAIGDEGAAARYASGIHILKNEILYAHFIGGGCMNSMWQENLARLAAGSELAKFGIPAIATGLGLTPLEDGSLDFALSCLADFKAVTVRDESSLNALSSLGNVELGADDCFVNGLNGATFDAEELPSYMACIQTDLVEDKTALLEHAVRQLDCWKVPIGERIGVVECNPYIDYPIFNALEEHGWQPTLFPAVQLLEKGLPVKENQTWLSTRYHPHLVAAAKGCRGSFIPLGNSFYKDKHQAVKRMGSNWTESRIGEEPVLPGPGFGNPKIAKSYMNAIRKTVAPFVPAFPFA